MTDEKPNLPATVAGAGDGWAAVPSRDTSMIKGQLVKFERGEYIRRDGQSVSGLELLVTGVATLWMKWQDGKPSDVRVTYEGAPHPRREELPDLDQTRWPNGIDGRPSDPWQDSRYLYLIDPFSAEEFTFATHSKGGHKAIEALMRQILSVRRAHPKASPVILLASEKWKTTFGLIPKPLFTVVSWRGGEAQIVEPPATPPPAPKPALAKLLNDDIPF